jgi:cytoplasmic iron level regulating protein YaaA (DUF328/UPF0246 family)
MSRIMLILLSPAKNLDWSAPLAGLEMSTPAFAKEAAALAAIAKKLKAEDLKRLMELSDKLADLNVARFKAFAAKPAPEAVKHAVLAFNGEVYQGLKAKTLSPDDLAWAQDRLRILSGLYGLLRPLDAIQPYRLEMGIKIANPRGEDLYDYWGDRIAKRLNADLAGGDVIVNLASDEYFSAVDRKALKAKIITPKFLDVKDGKARPVFLFVKQARGLMARYAIDKRIDDPATLVKFNSGGYKFDAKASSETDWVFVRPQPPPVAAKGKSARGQDA